MSKTYVVEHLDPELGQWSALEYQNIASECHAVGARFLLSSIPDALELPDKLRHTLGFEATQRGVEDIFAETRNRVVLLDPAAEQELSPEDADHFDVFLFGGILGDDPPRDRTSELRKKGYQGRRLGPVQMTTDTAVRVTRLVTTDRVPLDKIPYVDHPEIKVDEHESTEMPFRYVTNSSGQPIMPNGMIDLIKKDSEKSFGDLF